MNRDPRASDNSTPPPTQTDLPALLGALAGRLPALIFLASFVLAIAILYFGQTVLIPVAFSLLLTFLLSPIVDGLEGVGLGRIPSVVLVVILAFSVLASIGWIVTVQITTLVSEIPRYERNIRQKVIDLKQMTKGGTIEQVQKTVKEIKQEIEKEEKAGRKEAAPVVVQAERDSTFWPLPTIAGPVVERLASIGLAVVLVIFMLAERDELRNRLIRLVGYGRMTITTKALQDAGHRISRYLLMQSLINSAFGLAVAFGLFMIGLPYAALWGFLAAVLRFIPYVGPWVAAIMPAALGLAVFEGWLRPLAVAGLFVVLELLTNMILEPLLWGGSAGVSQVALLVSVAFWTWLWGPIGLLMATPLTVCLVVLGKYVPQLQYITVLMSDEPVAESSVVYYQRLLAMDREEAAQIVTAYVENHSRDQVYDRVLIPALNFAKMDRERGGLTDSEEQFIYQETRAILEKLDSEQGASMAASGTAGAARENGAAPRQTVRVLGCPARDEADEVALLMLKQLLASTRYEVEVIGDERLVSEVIAAAGEKRTGLIFIAALPPGGLAHTRYLCKRLRAQLSDLKIVVGLWGLPDEQLDAARKTLVAAGADQIGTSLLESRDQVSSLGQLISDSTAPSSPAPRTKADR